ncbi:adenylate kinase-domain-containing protein [Camillea tinctor]|nr:adenylate kinase-domain-containing protein [Camillea tinctor]
MQSQESTPSVGNPQNPSFMMIGLLGGPGSGKGTQCALLSKEFHLSHISVGDVLRKEMQREGSEFSEIIKQNMEAGTVGPKEITVGILRSHILEEAKTRGIKLFLLDGFPRNLDQAEYFEQVVGPIEHVVVLECPEDVLIERLLPRGRFDDKLHNIHDRLRTFNESTLKVIDAFDGKGKVKRVNANDSIEAVNKSVKDVLRLITVVVNKTMTPP